LPLPPYLPTYYFLPTTRFPIYFILLSVFLLILFFLCFSLSSFLRLPPSSSYILPLLIVFFLSLFLSLLLSLRFFFSQMRNGIIGKAGLLGEERASGQDGGVGGQGKRGEWRGWLVGRGWKHD
jgi:hypothetical protein